MKKSLTTPNLSFEQNAWKQGYSIVAGVDEAGRGPIAGPVVVAAVCLGSNWDPDKYPLNDSKKLSEKQRDSLFEVICHEAQSFHIVEVSIEIIDQLNILHASLHGMKEAAENLSPSIDYLLVDGNKYPPTTLAGETIVKGDSKSQSIAAASILAKVSRDRTMKDYSQLYPEYGFEIHKGYPTQKHRNAVDTYGLTPIHRKSFQCGSHPKPQQLELGISSSQ